MADDSKFVKADVAALEQFVQDSEDAITEFDYIKRKFREINDTLLSHWDGAGKAEYQKVADHIMDNITGIDEVLKNISEDMLTDIIDVYNSLDRDLADYNRHAGEKKK